MRVSTSVLCAIGCLGLTVPYVAQAADLPYRKAPPVYVAPPPVFTWTGFYVGAAGGYAFGGDDEVGLNCGPGGCTRLNTPGSHNLGKLEMSGGFGGGTVGYNWQMGRWVFGVAGDIFASGVGDRRSGTNISSGGVLNYTARSDVNWFGSGRGRLGYAFDRWLPYVTGGVAFGDVNYRVTATNGGVTGTLRNDDTKIGYTVGAGIEYAFINNWSVNVEYRYTNFGRDRVSGPVNTGGTFSTNETPNFHAVLAGVNYHF